MKSAISCWCGDFSDGFPDTEELGAISIVIINADGGTRRAYHGPVSGLWKWEAGGTIDHKEMREKGCLWYVSPDWGHIDGELAIKATFANRTAQEVSR